MAPARLPEPSGGKGSFEGDFWRLLAKGVRIEVSY
jgi:hypothetical protein